MKVVILAGGLGTRISEESQLKPKPMIEIGEEPILWHILKIYSYYGFNDFIICCGYKANSIKEYFANYYLHTSEVTFDFRSNGAMHVHETSTEPWKVTVVNTGLDTMTGGRIKRIKSYTEGEPFLLTYGDGVSDVKIPDIIAYHKSHKGILTITAIQPTGRFGALDIAQDGNISSFMEKPRGDGGWVNGGFFVCEQGIFDYIEGDSTIWEHQPLQQLASEGQLYAYKHHGFWQPMDTLRDKMQLEALWQSGKAPWKIW
jgi:glucose-1-phosphate cytidylyltransferase